LQLRVEDLIINAQKFISSILNPVLAEIFTTLLRVGDKRFNPEAVNDNKTIRYMSDI